MPIPDLAKLIATEIETAGISANELSRRAEVGLATVLDVRAGRLKNPGFLTLLKILGALGHDFRWLHARGFTPKSLGFRAKTTTVTTTVNALNTAANTGQPIGMDVWPRGESCHTPRAADK